MEVQVINRLMKDGYRMDMAFSGPVPGRILVATERDLGLLFISQQRICIFAHA